MIVTFEDYVPVPRYDGLPWTQITIEESALQDGPWTLIDTQALTPVDADPTSPQSRSFTTDNAVLLEGWYKISFKDAGGNTLPTDPVQNVEPSDINYRPTVGDVARKIMSRTRDRFGNLEGAFTPSTQPTDTQVVSIISDILPSIADSIGDQVPAAFFDDAQNVAALRAAMQIELDFYPEQVSTNRSPYAQLKELYEEELLRLQQALAADDPTTPLVDPTAKATRASWSMPDDPFFTRDKVW